MLQQKVESTGSKARPIVITGGAGFVGSQLGFALHQKGYDVTLVDDFSYGHLDNLIVEGSTFGRFVCKDIRESGLEKLFEGVDVVFHIAGVAPLPVCQANPGLAYDVNTSGTANVLEAARRAGVRLVLLASTSAVYECSPGERHHEADAIQPNLIYAMTKVAAEEICRAYAVNYGMNIIIARFFNVYGPHQDFKRKSPPFTSYLARELVAERPPVLYNKSGAQRDYIYVDDLVQLLERMAQSPNRFAAEVFNVGSGRGYSVPELVRIMTQVSGRSCEPEFREPRNFWHAYPELFAGDYPLAASRIEQEVFKHSVADISKAQKAFDWAPQVAIESGLLRVYEYALKASA